jgi:integrase
VRIVKEQKKNKPDGYLCRVQIDGRRLAVRGATKRQVELEVAELKDQADRRRRSLPERDKPLPDVTYAQLVQEVLESYQHTEQSRAALRYNLARSESAFGTVKLRNLDNRSIETWLARLGGSQTTRRHSLKAIRQALTKAIEWGYLRSNPASTVQMPREQLTPPRPFESEEEIDAVAAAFKTPLHQALVVFVCEAGLRSQEWRALRWCDIDRQGRSLRIAQTVRNGRIESAAKNAGSLRTVRLTARAFAALDNLPRPIDRTALVFAGRNGSPLDAAAFRKGPWPKALRAAGLEGRDLHSMRDTFATLALADGAPVEWVSKQLGHADISTTLKHYHRWLKSADDAILDKLEAERAGLKADSLSQEAESL